MPVFTWSEVNHPLNKEPDVRKLHVRICGGRSRKDPVYLIQEKAIVEMMRHQQTASPHASAKAPAYRHAISGSGSTGKIRTRPIS